MSYRRQKESGKFLALWESDQTPHLTGSYKNGVPFGNYKLLGKIAQGGMADVFYARNLSGSELLAIKCIRTRLANERRFVEMFIKEGKLAMLLDHPHIVRTYEVGEVDGRYFIAMEFIGGQDLSVVLKRCQETCHRMPIPHVIFIAWCVSKALHYAHTLKNSRGDLLNIVNRDISPSNIRLSFEGDVKLIDFGIAQAMLQASSEIGLLKGKFSYMSPEQIRCMPLDRRSDIFSLGIVLHEMLSCERLFRDASEFVLMEKIRRADIKPPSHYNKRVFPELDNVVLKALNREPELRYQDALTMSLELEGILTKYKFSPSELGEWLRTAFASEFRALQEKEHVLEQNRVKRLAEVLSVNSEPAPKQMPSTENVNKNKHTYTEVMIWLVAVLIFLVGFGMLMVALTR